jgi:tetratricopeptide (TPR) repeat protein
LAGAAAEYRRALQLNPSHLPTRLWYAEHLTRMARFDEAIAESGRALALDPVSPMSLTNRAMIFFRARRYDEAIRAGQQALDFDPRFVNALGWQGLSYAGNRDFPKAIACLTKAIGMNDGPLFRALLGHVYGRAGESAKARGILRELATMSERRFVSQMDFAVVYAGLGDADSTFLWLEKAYQTRATRISELRSMYFDSVRSDPRYADLMRRIGLPFCAVFRRPPAPPPSPAPRPNRSSPRGARAPGQAVAFQGGVVGMADEPALVARMPTHSGSTIEWWTLLRKSRDLYS